ncbi:MAG: hypothetical protein QOH96_3672, partial [Blastocatellia bacterium]|nr:hypothetical protein [Blastocatellia bacterium]
MNFNAPRPSSPNRKSAAHYFFKHLWLIVAVTCVAMVALAFSPLTRLRSLAAGNENATLKNKSAGPISTSSIKTGSSGPQTGTVSSDGIWEQTGEKNLPATQTAQATIQAKYLTLRLNKQSLAGVLATASLQKSTDARAVTVSLPLPDGSFGTFRIVESPIMEPALAARHPEVKTYSGIGVDDPTATTRFSWTPNGFEAIILSTSGTIYIVPAIEGNSIDYVCYSARDIATENSSLHCDTIDDETLRETLPSMLSRPDSVGTNSPAAGATLRTYRLAIATTGEFAQQFGGGTVNATFTKIALSVSSLNAIYERDLAISFILVADEDKIIFTDPATDPYDNSNVGSVLLAKNQETLDARIGSANYDIGHVFGGITVSPNYYAFSGIASIGVVCLDGFKARGAIAMGDGSAFFRPQLVGGVAHEMGHQFGAHHTFNATTNSFCMSQRSPDHAYEPGSGSTLMAFSLCASGGATENLQPADDNYFHAHSIEEILNYVATTATCASPTPSGDRTPTVSTGTEFTIPANTPFALTATATDPDGDALTYNWEEYDL